MVFKIKMYKMMFLEISAREKNDISMLKQYALTIFSEKKL